MKDYLQELQNVKESALLALKFKSLATFVFDISKMYKQLNDKISNQALWDQKSFKLNIWKSGIYNTGEIWKFIIN